MTLHSLVSWVLLAVHRHGYRMQCCTACLSQFPASDHEVQEGLQWVHGDSVAVRRKLLAAAVDDCQLQAWWCPETALALLVQGCNAEEGTLRAPRGLCGCWSAWAAHRTYIWTQLVKVLGTHLH